MKHNQIVGWVALGIVVVFGILAVALLSDGKPAAPQVSTNTCEQINWEGGPCEQLQEQIALKRTGG